MPTNNFKLFDENKANMMTDADYAIAQQRLNGVQSGVASSQLQNKTLYQTALMCYALAQLMAANGYDANDANAVSTFVNNMSLSVVQKVVDKASDADLVAKTVGKWVDAAQLGALKESVSSDYLKLAGGTMLGNLILNADPTQNLQAATKKYVDENGLLLYSGQYKGTGTYGESNPTRVTFPFEPILFFMPTYDGGESNIIRCKYLTTTYKECVLSVGTRSYTGMMRKSTNGRTIEWYVVSSSTATAQENKSGETYYYAAIGGYDMGNS